MTAAGAGQEAVEWADGTTESVSDGYVRLCAPAGWTPYTRALVTKAVHAQQSEAAARPASSRRAKKKPDN
jgi:hypothetical protein